MFSTLSSNRKLLLGFAVAWLVWLGLHNLVLVRCGWPLRMALADAGVSTLMLSIASLAVANVFRFYRPSKNKPLNLLWWALLLSAACTGGVHLLLARIFGYHQNYLLFLTHTWILRFGVAFLVISCVQLVSWIWYFAQEQTEMEGRAGQTLQLAKDAELASLRQQLQPHFLFNSLNSIAALVGSQPQQARNMIYKLSDFFRRSLRQDGQAFIPLAEELEHLHLYLDIEKVRFGNRLHTSIQVSATEQNMKVPAMLLQPVLENAIKFGLYDTIDEVEISLKASAANSLLILTITNPFDPETAPGRQGTGFGLASVNRRLHLLYGRQNLLQTERLNNHFITHITIPQPA